MRVLPRSFYRQKTKTVARNLLGKYLVREKGGKVLISKIVETEAYVGQEDLAAHSRFGRTTRNAAMFGPAGHVYVYLVYGLYYCLNIVTEEDGYGAAVLIRAAEPIKNIAAKTAGPGLLCRAMDINKSLYSVDVTRKGSLYILEGEGVSSDYIITTARIGVDYAKDWKNKKLRFYIKGNKYVSRR